ncbi:hypothetical protein V1525DRAFT_414765 [Lipomyces kononenkoae]|uniref:Uncharacterized protein n=1 Tax=Lipomyces kononenkoae TaxID=34357 RepID=A0ACC3SQM1_LIPKO
MHKLLIFFSAVALLELVLCVDIDAARAKMADNLAKAHAAIANGEEQNYVTFINMTIIGDNKNKTHSLNKRTFYGPQIDSYQYGYQGGYKWGTIEPGIPSSVCQSFGADYIGMMEQDWYMSVPILPYPYNCVPEITCFFNWYTAVGCTIDLYFESGAITTNGVRGAGSTVFSAYWYCYDAAGCSDSE